MPASPWFSGRFPVAPTPLRDWLIGGAVLTTTLICALAVISGGYLLLYSADQAGLTPDQRQFVRFAEQHHTRHVQLSSWQGSKDDRWVEFSGQVHPRDVSGPRVYWAHVKYNSQGEIETVILTEPYRGGSMLFSWK